MPGVRGHVVDEDHHQRHPPEDIDPVVAQSRAGRQGGHDNHSTCQKMRDPPVGVAAVPGVALHRVDRVTDALTYGQDCGRIVQCGVTHAIVFEVG